MSVRFTFRQLEYLVAVANSGSITLAADHVNVSPPSISSAITQLEAEFGVQLFVRQHAQGLSQTPGGSRIVEQARRLLHDAASLNDLAGDISETVRGPLTIGCLVTIAPMISAAIRRSFEAQYPEARIVLKEGHQADLLSLLSRAEIDIAISYDLDIPQDMNFTELVRLPPSVMLPASHPACSQSSIALSALVDEPMVLLDLPISREYFLSMFQCAGLRPNIAERTTEMSVMRSLVANEFGYSLVNIRSKTNFSADGQALHYLELEGNHRPMILGLITTKSNYESQIIRAFREHLSALAASAGLPGAEHGIT